jgi:hypothetical protein
LLSWSDHCKSFFTGLFIKLIRFRFKVGEIKAALDKAKKATDRGDLTKKWKRAIDMQMKWEGYAQQYEQTHSIGPRWLPTDDTYITHLKMLHDRQYRRALDNLSALLIRRLLELEKMGISGTGMNHLLLFLMLTNTQPTNYANPWHKPSRRELQNYNVLSGISTKRLRN